MPLHTFLLRIAVSIILLMHSIPAIIHNTIPDFGAWLNQFSFAPMGVLIAWLIKLSHIAAACCLMTNRWIKPACIVTLIILIAGIFMVHLPHGWFVVGAGTNGIEFNFLLICVLITPLFPAGPGRPGIKS